MLTENLKQKFKKRLLNEKKHVLDRVKGIDQGGLHESMSWSTSELSLYDNHPGDVASEVFERSKDFALREDALHMVRAIDDALDKMEQGAYGICDVCGGKISEERLEAVPYTTLCLNCKKGDEQIPRTENRPVEEEVMEDIYARPFDNKTENVEFDTEDAFQEVSRWNEHAVKSGAGSYYGAGEIIEEDQRGSLNKVDNITYEVGDDGVFYQSFRSVNDEDAPREQIDVGEQHTLPDEG